MNKYRNKIALADLYKDELFLIPEKINFQMEGEYTSKILFVVDNQSDTCVAEEDKKFIESILKQIPEINATLNSIGLINLKGNSTSLLNIVNQYKPQHIFTWGCAYLVEGTSDAYLQALFYGEIGLIHCHDIMEMKEDKNFKLALWNSMKKLFNIN